MISACSPNAEVRRLQIAFIQISPFGQDGPPATSIGLVQRGVDPGSDIFPADENRIGYVLPYVAMNRISWLLTAANMVDRAVALGSVPECCDHKIFVVSLTVGIHDRMMFSAADRAGRMNQIEIHEVFIQLIQRLLKSIDCETLLEIETTQHVKHCIGPVVTTEYSILSE